MLFGHIMAALLLTAASEERAGTLACNEGRFSEGIALLRKAGEPAREKLAACLTNAAEAERTAARFESAETYARESLELAIRMRAPVLEGFARNMLAHVLHEAGDYDEARLAYEHAIRLRREIGSKASLASTLSSYASLLLGRGESDRAQAVAEEAVTLLHSIDKDHPYLSTATNNLAQVYRMQQRYAEAEPLYREAIRLAIRHYGVDSRNARLLQTNFAAYFKEIGRTHASAALMGRASR